MSKFEQRERCLDGRKLNWLNALDYPCRPLNALKSIVIYEFRRRPDSGYALRSRRGVSNLSTKTAEAPVYGYAKRPRERAANKLSRPAPQLAKRSQFLLLLLRTAGWGGRSSLTKTVAARCAPEEVNKGKRPKVKLRLNPVRRNEPKFLNDYMEARWLEFIDENGGGPGVRLKRSTKGKDRK